MSADAMISVEVAYALPDRQLIVPLEVAEGTTAIEAIRQAGMEAEFPGLVVDGDTPVGIFGQAVTQQQPLQAGDRVEIYRPLLADPKAVRKARAEKAKARRESAAADES